MATKYGPRKRHNAGTIRKTTTRTPKGSRTRTTTSVKRGNFTFSRSLNSNGTVRQTKTHRSPTGWITRTVKTIGSKPSKPKAPKFIKPKVYKPPKLPKFRPTKTTRSKPIKWPSFSSGSSRRSRSYSSGASEEKGWFDLIFGAIFNVIWFIIVIVTSPIWIPFFILFRMGWISVLIWALILYTTFH